MSYAALGFLANGVAEAAPSPRSVEASRPGEEVNTDEALAARFAGGDEHALAELRKRYHGRLQGYFQRLAPPGQAEELTRETLRRMAAERFDPTAERFRAWLFRLAVTAAGRYPLSHPAPSPPAPAGPSSECLDALPMRLRQLVLLQSLAELTPSEIARALDCSLLAVSRRLARAHDLMRATPHRRGRGA